MFQNILQIEPEQLGAKKTGIKIILKDEARMFWNGSGLKIKSRDNVRRKDDDTENELEGSGIV